ncbi:MAG: hypothetical protein PHF57_04280 [Methanoregula sp.]|jgi:ribosomal protein L40E|nr:hypothetical protein [Methanoregula sp.]MDD5187406.1 hypothetical protein [Methanoregula sp.]
MAKKIRDTTKPTTAKAAIPIRVSVDGNDALAASGIAGEPRSPMTPQAATALAITPSVVDWLKQIVPVGDVEQMIKDGDYIVVERVKKNANRTSTPSLKSEQRTPRQQAMICQRCNRTIPTDANYCPYCAHPVSIPAAAAKTPNKVSRKASTAPRPVSQSAIDWYIAKYSDGAENIERWMAAGEFVIVEKKYDENGNCNDEVLQTLVIKNLRDLFRSPEGQEMIREAAEKST